MEMYIPDAMYLDHGEDDRCGGLATVKSISIFQLDVLTATFENIPSSFNLKYIFANQRYYRSVFGDRVAHMCPEGKLCPNYRKKGLDLYSLDIFKERSYDFIMECVSVELD